MRSLTRNPAPVETPKQATPGDHPRMPHVVKRSKTRKHRNPWPPGFQQERRRRQAFDKTRDPPRRSPLDKPDTQTLEIWNRMVRLPRRFRRSCILGGTFLIIVSVSFADRKHSPRPVYEVANLITFSAISHNYQRQGEIGTNKAPQNTLTFAAAHTKKTSVKMGRLILSQIFLFHIYRL